MTCVQYSNMIICGGNPTKDGLKKIEDFSQKIKSLPPPPITSHAGKMRFCSQCRHSEEKPKHKASTLLQIKCKCYMHEDIRKSQKSCGIIQEAISKYKELL